MVRTQISRYRQAGIVGLQNLVEKMNMEVDCWAVAAPLEMIAVP